MSRAEVIAYKNRIRGELSDVRGYLNTHEAARHRLRAQGQGGEFARKQLEKLETKIDDLTTRLNELSERLETVEGGDLQALYSDQREQAEESAIVLDAERRIQKQRSKQMAKDGARKEETYQQGRKERRSERWDKKKYKIYYSKFLQAADSLPSYMQENLETMPNNKGYVWRGVRFYGSRLPERGEPTVLFERSRGYMFIHKDYPDGRWEKLRKQNQTTTLVDSGIRKKKFVTPFDWPEVKYGPVGGGRPSQRRHHRERTSSVVPSTGGKLRGALGNRLRSWQDDRRSNAARTTTPRPPARPLRRKENPNRKVDSESSAQQTKRAAPRAQAKKRRGPKKPRGPR